jgi:hypothetical protein
MANGGMTTRRWWRRSRFSGVALRRRTTPRQSPPRPRAAAPRAQRGRSRGRRRSSALCPCRCRSRRRSARAVAAPGTLDVGQYRGVTAKQTMVAQDPKVARPADWILRRFRNLVLGLIARRLAVGQRQQPLQLRNPIRSRSKRSSRSHASSSASSASSQPACSAIWLSART